MKLTEEQAKAEATRKAIKFLIALFLVLLVAIGFLAAGPVVAETIEGGYGYGHSQQEVSDKY